MLCFVLFSSFLFFPILFLIFQRIFLFFPFFLLRIQYPRTTFFSTGGFRPPKNTKHCTAVNVSFFFCLAARWVGRVQGGGVEEESMDTQGQAEENTDCQGDLVESRRNDTQK